MSYLYLKNNSLKLENVRKSNVLTE